MKADELAIYCADIGAIKHGNFGWAVVRGDSERSGKAIGGLVDDVVGSLAAGVKVALGFECPLWVPVPDDPDGLTAGRAVDGNRAWSAGPGASALATGLTESAWILREVRVGLRDRGTAQPRAHLDWQEFAGSDTGIFLWEAFVTGAAKAVDMGKDGHMADALTACKAFVARLPDPRAGSVCEPAHAARSLVGAAVLWAGWSGNLDLLRARCLVVKPAGTIT
ncbi:MAG: hypothetical protein OXG71_09345 [Rhodospirillales bacterium]|nr:hypothetical protein [Rhodospirillales bacterium]